MQRGNLPLVNSAMVLFNAFVYFWMMIRLSVVMAWILYLYVTRTQILSIAGYSEV
jgi:hypothetical protein